MHLKYQYVYLFYEIINMHKRKVLKKLALIRLHNQKVWIWSMSQSLGHPIGTTLR